MKYQELPKHSEYLGHFNTPLAMIQGHNPFKSQAQRAFMYAKHPGIAKRWREEYGPQKGLPKYKR